MTLSEIIGLPINDTLDDRYNDSDKEILTGFISNYLSQINKDRRELTPTELLYDFAVWALVVGMDEKWESIEYDGVKNF